MSIIDIKLILKKRTDIYLLISCYDWNELYLIASLMFTRTGGISRKNLKCKRIHVFKLEK